MNIRGKEVYITDGERLFSTSYYEDEYCFSRYTPDDLEDYDDSDYTKMSHGQRKDLIVDEGEKADRNRSRYRKKGRSLHTKKNALGGAAIGAAIGAISSQGKPIHRLGAAAGAGAIGAGIGAIRGAIKGSNRGNNKATEEGHVKNKDRQVKTAKKIDETLVKKKRVKEANYAHELKKDWKREEEEARARAIEQERLHRERMDYIRRRELHNLKRQAIANDNPNIIYTV